MALAERAKQWAGSKRKFHLVHQKAAAPTTKFVVPTIKFVGEQDGPIERDLKTRFVQVFSHESMVKSAYLARADHSDGTGIHVTLAISHSCGEEPSLIPKLASIFSSMFGSHTHLDMMFLREDQEQQLRAVCAAFYQTGVP